MSIFKITTIVLIVIIGLITSGTDLKFGKIYNKHLIIFAVISIAWQVISVVAKIDVTIDKIVVIKYFINLIIGISIGFVLYYNDIWAAGDAKLFFVFLMLSPITTFVDSGLNVFPGFRAFIYIFSSAFVYIFLETLYLLGKEFCGKEKFLKKEITVNCKWIISILPVYFFTYIFTLCYNDILLTIVPDFYIYNIGILKFINFIFIFIILGKNLSKRIYILAGSIGMTYLIVKVIFFSKGNNYNVDFSLFLIVTAIIVIRYVSARYNYKMVNCNELKPGSVLSYSTIMKFLNSRVKGLPKYTTESTHSRLTIEEVESIKRWSKSKYGEDTVCVVRHLPFAPFIFLGVLINNIYILFVK